MVHSYRVGCSNGSDKELSCSYVSDSRVWSFDNDIMKGLSIIC